MNWRICFAAVLLAVVLGFVRFTDAQVIYDSGGFETGAGFSTTSINPAEPDVQGNVRGQPSSSGNPWVYSSTLFNTSSTTNASAVIVTSGPNTPAIGSQSLQVSQFQASASSWWFEPVNFTPGASNQIVKVAWQMNWTGAIGGSSQFGPFFGIDAYGTNNRIGGAGIDASTGEFLYEAVVSNTATFVIGPTIGTGWHSYELDFNYSTHTYSALVDSVTEASNINFITGGVSTFTDADVAALQDDAANPNPTGKAFFDSLTISAVPEPSAIVIGLITLGLILRRPRSAD